MPQYKLCYFNARGLAEVSRWIFAHAGQEYEDFRWEREDWPTKYKPLSPTGQGPYLEIDDVRIAQSTAIARYLANKLGLAGKTDLEKAQVDMIVSSVEDFRNIFRPILMEQDEAKKKALKETIVADQAPVGLARLENLLKANNGGDGYCVGDSVTWADFQMAIGLSFLERLELTSLMDKYPQLKSLAERIVKLPKIAEWIAKRPDTQM